jgi:hypothetical protein
MQTEVVHLQIIYLSFKISNALASAPAFAPKPRSLFYSLAIPYLEDLVPFLAFLPISVKLYLFYRQRLALSAWPRRRGRAPLPGLFKAGMFRYNLVLAPIVLSLVLGTSNGLSIVEIINTLHHVPQP